MEMVRTSELPTDPTGILMVPISEPELSLNVITVVFEPKEVVLKRHEDERDTSSSQVVLPPPFRRGLRVLEGTTSKDFILEVNTDIEGPTDEMDSSTSPTLIVRVGEWENSAERGVSPISRAAELGLADLERERLSR